MAAVLYLVIPCYNESNLFLRGIIPQLGFKQSVVYYSRAEREAGTTHYPLSKMISLGVIGEYIGKIYLETKGRPRYIVSERKNIPEE